MHERRFGSALRVSVVYLVVGVGWILLSDWAAASVAADLSELFLFQLAKGAVFVVGSAGLLYWLVSREQERWEESEDELEEARSLLQRVLGAISDAVLVIHVPTRTIADCNAAAVEMFGYEREELVGASTELLHVDREHYERFGAEGDPVLARGRAFRTRWELERADGEVFPTEQVVSLVEPEGGGEPEYAVSVVRDVTEREAAERALEESNRLLDAVVEGTSDAVFAKDRGGRYLLINAAGARLVGRRVEDVIGRTDEAVFPPDLARQVRADDLQVMERGEPLYRVEEVETADGERRVLDTLKAPLRDGEEIVGVLGISRDVTEREAVERALEHTEEKYRTLFHAAPMGISVSTLDGSRFLEVNEGFEALLGYDRGELLGRRALALDIWVEEADRSRLVERLRGAGGVQAVHARLRRKDGDVIEARVAAEVLTVDGDEHLLAVTRDVTEERRFERELERMALHDSLTGLANRSLFLDRLERALAAADRHGHPVAVLFVDLDRFKVVNDTLGHPAGDLLLEEAADRIAASFREEDTVARLGGDEFGVLLERMSEPGEVERAADRLMRAFEAPFHLGEEEVHVSASAGIALRTDEPVGSDALLRFSDIAMYRAKEEPGSSYHRYDPDRDAVEADRLHRETELRRAIEQEAFELHYQPVVSLRSGRIVGAEALLRWRHPERGLVYPSEFVSMAEETGLVVPLGDWVVRTAARQARDWTAGHGPSEGVHLGINVSARQLREGGVAGRFLELLSEADFDPSRAIVEITESATLRNRDAIRDLRELGIRVAMDDLGTGYASLEYLTHVDVDVMKVDRLFVSGLGENVRDEAIVEAAGHIAQRLDIPVVAEGVETEAQLVRLREIGYDYAQGYLFGEPLPAPAFERLLAEDPVWEAAG